MRCSTRAISLLVVAFAIAGPGVAEAQKQKLVLACSQTASSFYAACVAMAQAINQRVSSVDVSVMETGGAVQSMRRMQKNEADIALSTGDQMFLAWRGADNWKDTTFEDIRLLLYFTISANVVIVREDSGVRSVPELSGRKFNPGTRGSSTEKMTETVLLGLGVKPDWQRMGTSDAVDAIKDKRIIGYAKAGSGFSLDSSTMDIATQTAIRVLPFTEQDMKKSKQAHPHIPWVKVPAGAPLAKGIGEFWTMGLFSGLSVRKSFPKELVSEIMSAISETGAGPLKAAFPGTVSDIPKATAELATTPVHAGTLSYLRQRGITVPEQLVPSEAR
ncbi:MAG: TAXI family TRAP transporter solute-binding subunit [Candidatus Rokubacteria bacterium]|nr:TAXI family TRAP transporter solute-binding subunit [Candidatus Rokubacteria bacterium]